jgi:glycerol uptake facilitator-like aquaporin
MTDNDRISQPTESIYFERPSWAPPFLALGLALLVCGIFAEGFMVRGWVYSIIGAIFALAALWSLLRSSIRDFYRLPRRQRARGAVLPVTTLRPPKRR